MATYLQLCQKLASESGTVPGETRPTTVVGQTGRLGRVVRWVNDAWRSIQISHDTWLWMHSDFSGTTTAGQREYSGADLGVASRFGGFIYTGDMRENRYTSYLTATGVEDEGQLQFRSYDHFFTTFMRGTQVQDRPVYFTIAPNGNLLLHSIPDDNYTIIGPYRKDVQELTSDGDVPEMPARYHDLIVEVALMYLGTFDEATTQLPLWKLRERPRFSSLERDQLPRPRWPGALA